MRTVFTNSMTAHVWAQQTQPSGHSDSMSFAGAVLLSYSTPIAAFAPTEKGMKGTVPLFTAQNHSNTTAKHLGLARRAVNWAGFTVPDIGHAGGWENATARRGPASDPASWAPVHAVNLRALETGYHQHATLLLRINSWDEETVAEVEHRLRDAGEPAENYARTFGLGVPILPYAEDAARIVARRERLNQKRADPKYQEKREAERERRETAKRKKSARLAAEARQNAAEAAAAWLAGERIYLPYEAQTDENGSALLRVVGDTVQTSRGATVPLDHARRALALVESVKARGERWVSNGHTVHLGHFTLEEVSPEGDIRAGCHFIRWAQIERIAPALRAS